MKHDNLTSKLLESLILDENVSEGTTLLEDMEDIIIYLEQYIQKEKDCRAEDETTSVQTQEKVKEKKESPTMLKGRMVMTCPKAGGAGKYIAPVQSLEKVKEKQVSPTIVSGILNHIPEK